MKKLLWYAKNFILNRDYRKAFIYDAWYSLTNPEYRAMKRELKKQAISKMAEAIDFMVMNGDGS